VFPHEIVTGPFGSPTVSPCSRVTPDVTLRQRTGACGGLSARSSSGTRRPETAPTPSLSLPLSLPLSLSRSHTLSLTHTLSFCGAGVVHRDLASRNVLVFLFSPSDREQVRESLSFLFTQSAGSIMAVASRCRTQLSLSLSLALSLSLSLRPQLWNTRPLVGLRMSRDPQNPRGT